MPPLGLSWVNLGTTFSFLGAILGLLSPRFLMPCLALVILFVPWDPPDADFSRILIKMHQNSIKISSGSRYLGCSWIAQTCHLLGPTFTESQSFYSSRPPSLQAHKPPSLQLALAGDAKRKQSARPPAPGGAKAC